MSYSCLEELQVDLDLHTLDKTNILSKVGCKCNEGWFVITDDGICHLFDRNGNLDDIRKIKRLNERHIRSDITKIVIPKSVTIIGSSAFFYCDKLMSMTIQDGVTSIGNEAFSYCSMLTNVTIPDSVTSIEPQAFVDCASLTSMIIPAGVISIGELAFEGCDGLTNLIFKNKTFEQVKKMTDYPWGLKDESIIKVG